MALFVLGGIREILGSKTLLGYQVMPGFYEPWLVMILPAGAFLTLGILMGFSNSYALRKKRLQRNEIIERHMSKRNVSLNQQEG